MAKKYTIMDINEEELNLITKIVKYYGGYSEIKDNKLEIRNIRNSIIKIPINKIQLERFIENELNSFHVQ